MENSENILVLTPRLPYPVVGGDKLRIYKICEYLKSKGYSLTLLSFVESNEQKEIAKNNSKKEIFDNVETVKLSKIQSYINSLLGLFSDKPLQVSYYKSGKMKKLVKSKINSGNFDTVLVHLIRMAQYVPEDSNINKVLEMTDAISLNYKRNREAGGKNFKSIIYNIEESRVKKYEKRCLERFDSTVLVSEIDKDYLVKEFKNIDESKIRVITNGVSEEFVNYNQKDYNQNQLIFIGNLRSHQNEDAILYFLKEIYSLVRKQNPEIKIKVIGSSPSSKVKKYDNKEGIEVTGEVDSVIESAKHGTASVVPVRIGAGVQNKVLESMAMGIPVITTPTGAEGIDELKDEESVLISEDKNEFAKDVIRITKEKELRNKLSSQGKEIIKNNYSWDKKLQEYLEVI